MRACSPNPRTWPASPSTDPKFCCLAKKPGEADDGGNDENDGGMAESLNSTCLLSTLPSAGTGASVAPEVNVIFTAVVVVTVAEPPSFLLPAVAWQ